MATKKLCKDCKFCNTSFLEPKCEAPQNDEGDLVFGRCVARFVFCRLHREEGWLAARVSGTCGKSGRWFQKKD